jgi:hypothetical protein
MDLGETQATNPRAFHTRTRYHKMYYYYKPGKTYWMLVILARKVGIAFCSLVFRTNPGFMLASIVLILFLAFSLQTKHSPYMSTSQRSLVLAEHSIKVEAGDPMHLRIHNNILHVTESQMQRKASKGRALAAVRFSSAHVRYGGSDAHPVKKKKGTKEEEALRYFFDYNTVELTLLFCGILVCLAGIMFESDRFEAGEDASATMRYAWQRDSVTFFVIFIVMSSFSYLAIVMANEITGYTPKWLLKCFRPRQSALLSAANTIQNQKDDQIEMSVLNPTMVQE